MATILNDLGPVRGTLSLAPEKRSTTSEGKAPTVTTYTPLTPQQARSRLANAARSRVAANVARCRADLAVANLVKAIDQMAAAGTALDRDRMEFVTTHLSTRLGMHAEVAA